MGVESHFCSVSLAVFHSPSLTVYIHNTHSYTHVYRLMLPSLCPAQQGPGNGGVCGGDGGVTRAGGQYFPEGTQRTAGGMN